MNIFKYFFDEPEHDSRTSTSTDGADVDPNDV
jgi:hypothetical protein